MEVGIKVKLMQKVTIEMACSINGLIATVDGNEDFLSYRVWEIMIELLKEYDVLIDFPMLHIAIQ